MGSGELTAEKFNSLLSSNSAWRLDPAAAYARLGLNHSAPSAPIRHEKPWNASPPRSFRTDVVSDQVISPKKASPTDVRAWMTEAANAAHAQRLESPATHGTRPNTSGRPGTASARNQGSTRPVGSKFSDGSQWATPTSTWGRDGKSSPGTTPASSAQPSRAHGASAGYGPSGPASAAQRGAAGPSAGVTRYGSEYVNDNVALLRSLLGEDAVDPELYAALKAPQDGDPASHPTPDSQSSGLYPGQRPGDGSVGRPQQSASSATDMSRHRADGSLQKAQSGKQRAAVQSKEAASYAAEARE